MALTWAFDIECENWDTLVLAAAVCEDGTTEVFYDSEDVAEWYLNLDPKDEVIAHNGGGYDFLYLISIMDEFAWSANMAGSSIVSCRVRSHANLRDSFRLFPSSLAKWTGRKDEVGLTCICENDCGGYCAISRSLPPPQMRRLADYCVQDCRALLETWQEDLGRLESEGLSVFNGRGKPRSTIGAVAWNTAAPLAGIDPAAPVSWPDYDAGRLAYYGGRTEVGKTDSTVGHRYDVNAMYPWALTLPVPYGMRESLFGEESSRAYGSGRPGLYNALVEVPETDIPPLPHRYSDDAKAQGRLMPGRLLWTTGRFEGWWTFVELAAAERHGAKVLRVKASNHWSHHAAIFKPYVESIYGARRAAKEQGDMRWAGLLKWFANSLSGKLAQQPEVTRLVVLPEDENPGEGWHPVAGRVWAQTTRKVASCGRTWAAAYLTSRAREKLLDRMKRHSGAWLYCDTDSTYLVNRDDAGVDQLKLGAWGYEGECNDWTALAPKLYRYRDEDAKEHVRARGVPRPSWATLDAMRAGETVRREMGVHRIKTSGGTFQRRTIARTHHDAFSDRCGTRFVNADGTTRPLHSKGNGEYT